MARYREKTSPLFTKLASVLGRKQRPVTTSSNNTLLSASEAGFQPATFPPSHPVPAPAPQTSLFFELADEFEAGFQPVTVPPSHPVPAPAPQTSLIFELPDELILSILSHIAPDPQLASNYARFRIRHMRGVSDDHHQQRVEFLRPLSMTCRAMRLRLLPWVWERLEVPRSSRETCAQKFDTAVNGLRHAGTLLAISVKFMTVHLLWDETAFYPLVKCLRSLPNLHTLEVGWVNPFTATTLEGALRGVQLPQIKTLIMTPDIHPLLRHCHNVEDVVCVVGYRTTSFDVFLGSLASNQGSKIKRLAIPPALWTNPSPSVLVAACPRLTELTITYPGQLDGRNVARLGNLFGLARSARSAVLELVAACEALPDFDTLQIARFPFAQPPRRWDQEQAFRKEAEDLKDLAIDCLKKSKTGCQERRKGTALRLRVIEFDSDCHLSRACHSGPVKVEEYEA